MQTTNPDAFTIFLIDDDEGILETLSSLLRSFGYTTKTYSRPQIFLDEHDASIHGCAVLDLSMPDLNGTDVQQQLLKRGVDRPIIFLTGNGTIPASVEAMRAGAIDFLAKPFQGDELLKVIRIAQERDRLRLRKHTEQVAVDKRLALLWPREREVLDLVVSGLANKDVAATLGITLRTVKEHRARVFKKMGVKKLAELVRMMVTISRPATQPTHKSKHSRRHSQCSVKTQPK